MKDDKQCLSVACQHFPDQFAISDKLRASKERLSQRCSSTTENVAGHRLTEIKGQCFAVVVRSRGLGGIIMAGLARQNGDSSLGFISVPNWNTIRNQRLWYGASGDRFRWQLARNSP